MKENNPNAVTKSAVHKADFVSNKWNIGLMGFNDTTGGYCTFCYSHSSYFAERPSEYLVNEKGQYINEKGYVILGKDKITNEYWKDFNDKWKPTSSNPNSSLPVNIKP
ncbi:Uncharacterised protein [[Actinobacillus] rossii]|uniref:Uncharacterized protein n=1 Tax=[Actinobacillus] rossii TaxID=123820 RepID=A0A376BDS0_9PAST|nr:Uncharacterised protein [[Actinobacillus] rossii]